MNYLVWVGGVCDLETTDHNEADRVAGQWRDQGYEDVIVEKEIV